MAIIWIVTTGNSDLKLNSEYDFCRLRTAKNLDLKPCHKTFTKLVQGNDHLYSLPARVMGTIYTDTWESHQDYYRFPLIELFTKKLKKRGEIPDYIFVVLSNQEEIFLEDSEDSQYDRCENSPYWRDTCCLEPILKRHFDKEFGESKTKFIYLKPKTKEEGLDNWDAALSLVQEQFKDIKVGEDDTIFISHQAGTPAISSAVQFSALALFDDRVEFLVSNEHDPTLTRFIQSSRYLQGIKREQAKKQLKNYDYAGVKDLVGHYLDNDSRILLESAIQWNFAHFMQGRSLIKKGKKSAEEGFLEKLMVHRDFSHLITERKGSDNWWWEAYESAYLGVVRLRQGNTVEAVFHSFRSVEGLLKSWAEQKYPQELTSTKHPQRDRNLRSYGEDLYSFLDMKRKINQVQDIDIWIFGNVIIKRRNELFHNIKGLNNQADVFKAWQSSNEPQWKEKPEEKWKNRILNCLNFIIKKDLPEGFASLEEASLMAQVHKKLVSAIAHL